MAWEIKTGKLATKSRNQRKKTEGIVKDKWRENKKNGNKNQRETIVDGLVCVCFYWVCVSCVYVGMVMSWYLAEETCVMMWCF